jgi:UDP-N-acetyl-D-glucosamine dehydrogenase
MKSAIKSELISKLQTRQARVAVIGLGYVGLPLAVVFAQAGYEVIGIDVDVAKVDAINRGESYIEDIPSQVLGALVQRSTVEVYGNVAVAEGFGQEEMLAYPANGSVSLSVGTVRATTDFSVLRHCDAVSICVPTPLRKTGDPDISYILGATEQIAQYLHPGMVIVLESTTYPGTTREVLLEQLQNAVLYTPGQQHSEGSSLRAGQNFFLAFSPERVDPGRTDWTTRNTPKVLGGVTPSCLEAATAFYRQAIETIVPVSSPEAAEMVKLFENTFRAVNIGLANELLLMCDKLGLDAWEVLEAAATKPFGFMKFTPGPGLGGHCIPIDPLYLSWKLRTLQYNARFIELASEINTSMPHYWVQKIQDALNEDGKAVKGSQILVLGVAYKRDVSDLRESPALDIIHLLSQKGATVHYHDPHVDSFQIDGLSMRSATDLDDVLATVDCVVVATDHSVYDWSQIAATASLLIDTRHVTTAFSL